ncbi:MAG TPA: hypothetical protein ENJ99_02315, partial [Rhizobiales bacterium]|nr:hypothetical protein [Hyphomicrobiales bacterium]
MPLLRIFAGILLCLLASRGVHAQSGAAAQGIIDAGFRGDSINLMSVLKRVETTRADAVIEIPADASGQKAGMQLSASIAGARHRWAVFTLHNPAAASREFVLEIPDGGFVSSGVVWPRLYSRHVRSLRTSNGAAPRPVNALNAEAFVLSVGAGKTVTFAAELTPASLTKAVLWHRAAFDNQISQLTFFYGVLLGIAGLTAIAVVSLFIVRPQMVFPAAGLFVWACVVFLALNAGYYQVVEAWAPAILPGPARARALAESAMFAGIALTLTSFLQLARRQLVLFAFFVLLALSGFALMWLGLSNPAPASGLARIGFAITVVSGLATILALRADGVIRAKASLFSWLLLTAWTLAAAAGALGLAGSLFIGQAISAGLVLVLVAFG